MVVEISDFVFDKHILPLERSVVEKALRARNTRSFLGFRWEKKKINLNELVDRELEMLNGTWLYERDFFEEMRKQGYCNVEYQVERDGHDEFHQVVLRGGEVETFDINGLPDFTVSEKTNTPLTFFPVRKGSDEFNLIFYQHPQVKIPIFGELEVEYRFETSFSLGSSRDNFTSNPLDIHGGRMGSRCWYGKPGQVYYRSADMLTHELIYGVFGSCFKEKNEFAKRKNFNMQGCVNIKSGGMVLYQGPLGSDGTFPFFIRKNPMAERNETNMPRPKVVVYT